MDNDLKLEIQELAKRITEMNGLYEASEIQKVAKSLYDKVTILTYLESLPKTEVKGEIIEFVPSNEKEVEPELIEQDDLEEQQMLSTLNEDLFVSNEPMDESLMEPATEKIIDLVAQMPPEADQIDELIQEVVASKVEEIKNDKEDVTPLASDIKKQSLNDRLKKGITIGLNDRIAFVKHLFNGSTEDFNRVMSQLNTLTTELEALEFLNGMVKPEYNNWSGKEDYEQRFLSLIEGKYA